jgi:hypothetical protein
MRRIFSFRVLAIAVAAPIISAREALPERLLSPKLETDCVGGEDRGSVWRLETGEAQYLKPSTERPNKARAEAKERLWSLPGRGGRLPGSLRRRRRLNTTVFVGPSGRHKNCSDLRSVFRSLTHPRRTHSRPDSACLRGFMGSPNLVTSPPSFRLASGIIGLPFGSLT